MKELEFTESGAPRAFNAMRGIVPTIHSLSFITGENKCGVNQPPEENNRQNRELLEFLISGKFGYQKVKGQYNGVPENTFLIRNMAKSIALNLGDILKQESIIYGERFEEGEYHGFLFEMIGTLKKNCGKVEKNFGQVLGTNKVFVNRKNGKNNYSEIKGRRFVIPFFDTEDTHDDKIVKTNYDKASWVGNTGTIQGFDKTITPISKEDEDEVNSIQESILNSCTQHSYHMRGKIKKILSKYLS